jgi:predicted N-acetyltransferase YhbS
VRSAWIATCAPLIGCVKASPRWSVPVSPRSVQLWPLLFTGDDGARVPLTLVGPVAVSPDRQQKGIGRTLMRAALAAVPDHALMLIGDPEYYGRFFGFTAERTAGWRLPGPVDLHRLLARGDTVPLGAGTIGPRVNVSA